MKINIEKDIEERKKAMIGMAEDVKISYLLSSIRDLQSQLNNVSVVYYQTRAHLEAIIYESEGITPVEWEKIKSVHKAKNWLLNKETLER